jgi:hypothetical protein
MAMVAPLSFSVLLLSDPLIGAYCTASCTRHVRHNLFSLSCGGVLSFLVGALTLGSITFWITPSKKRLLPVLVFLGVLLAYLLYLGANPIIQRFAETDLTQNERFTMASQHHSLSGFPCLGTGLERTSTFPSL